MTDYVELWYRNLITQTSGVISQHAEAWGEYKRHLGPRFPSAKVKIRLGPSNNLQILDKLDPSKSAILKRNGYYDYVILGVLDVMLTHLVGPYRLFRLTILDAEIDEIESTAMAFRLAARDAVTKMLPQLWESV